MVTSLTNLTIDCFAGPSFHEGKGCAQALAAFDATNTTASIHREIMV
jgi:hypothetical protein